MKDSAHLHFTKANDYPFVYDDGKSDWYLVGTSDGRPVVAVYRRDDWWEDEYGEPVANVEWWSNEFSLPGNWKTDRNLFGGDEKVPEILKEISE